MTASLIIIGLLKKNPALTQMVKNLKTSKPCNLSFEINEAKYDRSNVSLTTSVHCVYDIRKKKNEIMSELMNESLTAPE